VDRQAVSDLDTALPVGCRQDDSSPQRDLLRTARPPSKQLKGFAKSRRWGNLTGLSPWFEHCPPPGKVARNWAGSSYFQREQMSSTM